MPPNNTHVPATGIDDAHDFFNRVDDLGIPATASTTALINAQVLPTVGTTVFTPGQGGGTVSTGTYGGRGATITTPVANVSDNGVINKTYDGVLLWKLDVPRTLQYVSDTVGETGSVIVVGLDRKGVVRTETKALVGVTVQHGAIPFAFIISVTYPTAVTPGAVCSVGTDTKLGMKYRPLDADSEHRVYVTGAKGTNGTIVAGTTNTYTPNAAPNGARHYVVVYDSID